MTETSTRCEPGCSPVKNSSLEAGRLIAGRYRLLRVLGEGAMGIVWEAVHVELGRPVAIKVLTEAALTTDSCAERFAREARAACRIDHPNVVRVLDFGRLPAGAPFLVMELLAGETLEDVLERRLGSRQPMALAEVCRWLAPIAKALDVAHALGIVHRDVKPANIMRIEREGEDPRYVLVDFGLASLYAQGDARLTKVGAVLGTPAYLAPEGAAGDRVDARADVYSLACIAFELLTGHVPHERDTLMQTLTAKLTEPAPRLSDVAGYQFLAPLEALMASALATDPNARPSTAGDLVRGLVRIAEGRIPAPQRTDPPPPPKPSKRRGGLWMILAGLFVIGLSWLWLVAPDAALAFAR
jgi:serine/threonine protein kinase